MLTDDNYADNPHDVVFGIQERLAGLVNALLDANDQIDRYKLNERHWGNYKAVEIANNRRTILIPRLRSYMGNGKLEGVETTTYWNTFLIIFDRQVAMYIRKGSVGDLHHLPPQWMSDKDIVLIPADPPKTMPLPFLEEDFEGDTDFDRLQEELRLRDLTLIIGIYFPDNEGKIAAFYIGTPKGDTIEDLTEVALTRPNIAIMGFADKDETDTSFGDDDVDSEDEVSSNS